MSTKRTRKKTLSETLRQKILESRLPFKTLEVQTGVKRQSLMKFAKGEQSLRLDIADKLADFFDLELTPKKRKK